ncbi:TPA: hypothetical protein L4W52_000372 [Pseudomonas aeruginosa]|nr:hypothetical protein [Pseudomonas aeruginosa]
MYQHLSNLMEAEKPRTAPLRCPLEAVHLDPSRDFPHWWKRAARLVDLPADILPTALTLAGAAQPLLLKRLQVLDSPRRALLLTMACLANPQRAAWLQAEVGLHVGQLTATDLGAEVFQVLVGLLATFHPAPSN